VIHVSLRTEAFEIAAIQIKVEAESVSKKSLALKDLRRYSPAPYQQGLASLKPEDLKMARINVNPRSLSTPEKGTYAQSFAAALAGDLDFNAPHLPCRN
jgi:hypothetical protein